MLEEAARRVLLADSGVDALVDGRIYNAHAPERTPEGTAPGGAAILPMAVYRRESTIVLGTHLGGRSATAQARLVYACRAARSVDAWALARAIAVALEGVVDTLVTVTSPADAVRVKRITLDDIEEDPQDPRPGAPLGEYVVRAEFVGVYLDTETLPAPAV